MTYYSAITVAPPDSSDADGVRVAEIFVPCIVVPILLAVLIVVIVKMKKNKDKLKINTDLLDDRSSNIIRPDLGKRNIGKVKETKEGNEGGVEEEDDDEEAEQKNKLSKQNEVILPNMSLDRSEKSSNSGTNVHEGFQSVTKKPTNKSPNTNQTSSENRRDN